MGYLAYIEVFAELGFLLQTFKYNHASLQNDLNAVLQEVLTGLILLYC